MTERRRDSRHDGISVVSGDAGEVVKSGGEDDHRRRGGCEGLKKRMARPRTWTERAGKGWEGNARVPWVRQALAQPEGAWKSRIRLQAVQGRKRRRGGCAEDVARPPREKAGRGGACKGAIYVSFVQKRHICHGSASLKTDSYGD